MTYYDYRLSFPRRREPRGGGSLLYIRNTEVVLAADSVESGGVGFQHCAADFAVRADVLECVVK